MSEKLKTLKDLEKTQKFKGVRHRGKKGTIYGIKTNYGICSEHIQEVVYTSVLKQEAIKWLKEYRHNGGWEERFIYFFNITEEELNDLSAEKKNDNRK